MFGGGREGAEGDGRVGEGEKGKGRREGALYIDRYGMIADI